MGRILRAPREAARCSRGRQRGDGRASRGKFWGKRREADWQALARAGGAVGQRPRRQSDGSYLLHPCAHLAWTSRRRGDRTGGGGESAKADPVGGDDQNGPLIVNFGVSNSAQCTLALPVDWQSVDRLAGQLHDGIHQRSSGSAAVVMASRQTVSGWWQVADVRSLEITLAHALADLPVKAKLLEEQDAPGVELLPDRLPRPPEEDGSACREGHRGIGDGLTDFRQLTASRVTCNCDPQVLVHSRWEDSCCWPKVWALREVLRQQGGSAWSDEKSNGSSLGTVPIRWSAEDHSWTAGNRHRVVAALLARQPMRATLKAKQVVSWAQVDRDGELIKWPAELWRAPGRTKA